MMTAGELRMFVLGSGAPPSWDEAVGLVPRLGKEEERTSLPLQVVKGTVDGDVLLMRRPADSCRLQDRGQSNNINDSMQYWK